MPEESRFVNASPFQTDVLALPVEDVEATARWCTEAFQLVEVERRDTPHATILMERDGVRFGFAENGGDSTQDGAAILVDGIAAVRDELEDRGVDTANWRVDERDGEKLQVFFVVAPDGLCYYFYEPIEAGQ